VLPAERAFPAEHAELIQAEQNHKDAADARKPDTAAAEEPAQRRKAEAERKKGKADAQNKERHIQQHLAARIADVALRGGEQDR